jgi:hypothetical protein
MGVRAMFAPRDLEVLVKGMREADSLCTREIVRLGEDGEAIVLWILPRPLMDTEMVSPGLRNTGGFLPMPTPAGFPFQDSQSQGRWNEIGRSGMKKRGEWNSRYQWLGRHLVGLSGLRTVS